MRGKNLDKIKTLYWKFTYNYKLLKIKHLKTDTYISYINKSRCIYKKGNIEKNIERIIWSYWNEITPPIDITNFINNNRDINNNFNYIVVNDSNLLTYLENFPEHIIFPSVQHKADLIRLMLLEKYGGIWIDITTILTTSLDWIINLQKSYKVEYLGFYNPNMMVENHHPMIENWFMAAVKDSEFIKNWLAEFIIVLETKSPRDYYQKQPYFDQIKQNIQPPFDRTFTMHLACQKIMLNNNYSYYLINAEDDGLFFNYQSKDRIEYCSNLLINKYHNLPKVIKITGGDRIKLSDFIKRKIYSKNSIYYKFKIINNH